MEAIKFAFDTLLVGALALPWLSVLMQMHFPPANQEDDRYSALVSALPKHTREVAMSVMVLSLGYFLGAAVWRISDDFFRDPDVLRHMPTEVSIREDVYVHEYCDIPSNTAAATPVPGRLKFGKMDFCRTDEDKKTPYEQWHDEWTEPITQLFREQEYTLLLQGDDRTTRFRELHDQDVILRGAALNGLTLAVLCLFGFCASFRSGSRHWSRFVATHVPAAVLILYGAYEMLIHLLEFKTDPDPFRDPPLAEAVIFLLGLGGLRARASEASRWKYAHGCWLSLILTFVAYGAWWWTEVIYNQGVLHARVP
jgi:succinate dehydrogenase hydrophobic anchor subunit